jgi:hypothetical protein
MLSIFFGMTTIILEFFPMTISEPTAREKWMPSMNNCFFSIILKKMNDKIPHIMSHKP